MRAAPAALKARGVRGAGAHQHALHDCRRMVRAHRHQLQLARDHELAVPQRDPRPRQGPGAADIFFSSKGHDAPALYCVLIGLGLLPADKLHQLRRLHGLPGHPHVETPFIQANTGSLGMGISKAKGMAIANRQAGTPRRIFVLTGDGELQEGQFWESLGSAANRRSRRDRRHRRSQQDPVGHLGRRTSAVSAISRRSFARSAGT